MLSKNDSAPSPPTHHGVPTVLSPRKKEKKGARRQRGRAQRVSHGGYEGAIAQSWGPRQGVTQS